MNAFWPLKYKAITVFWRSQRDTQLKWLGIKTFQLYRIGIADLAIRQLSKQVRAITLYAYV